jgi:hypothetical protein
MKSEFHEFLIDETEQQYENKESASCPILSYPSHMTNSILSTIARDLRLSYMIRSSCSLHIHYTTAIRHTSINSRHRITSFASILYWQIIPCHVVLVVYTVVKASTKTALYQESEIRSKILGYIGSGK